MEGVPRAVLECKDVELRNYALAVFSRGTLREKNEALMNCWKHADMLESQKNRQARLRAFETRLAYYRENPF